MPSNPIKSGRRLATDFVLRELSEQGPGYALLFKELTVKGWSNPGDTRRTMIADLARRLLDGLLTDANPTSG